MPQHSVKSAVRVFEILEYFAHCRRPARLTDIAKHLHYPVSSVNALLKSLVVQGYMKFNARTHLYIPAARLGHVTSWINFDGFEQAVMLDAMRRLRDVANGPVALASPIDIYLEYVETLAGTNETDLRIKPGTRRILIQTGTGWLFLSRKSRAYARSIYRQTIDRKELTRLQFPEAEFFKQLDAHAELDISFSLAKDLVLPVAHWDGAMISMIMPVPPGHRELALCAGGRSGRLERKLELISNELQRIAEDVREIIIQSPGWS